MNDVSQIDKFKLGLLRVASDRKLMRDFDPEIVERKIKRLTGYKEALKVEGLIELIEDEFVKWSNKKNMFVVIAILRQLYTEANVIAAKDNSSGAKNTAETEDTSEEVEETEQVDDEDEDGGGGREVIKNVQKFSDIIGQGIGIPTLIKKIRDLEIVKATYTKAENAYFKFLGGVYKVKKAILTAKTGWDDAAFITLEKAMKQTEDYLALRPMWFAIWVILKIIHYLLLIAFLIARPWTILEKFGVDPDAIPIE